MVLSDNFSLCCWLTVYLLSLFLAPSYLDFIKLCSGNSHLSVECIGTEREELLAFKNGLTDPSGRLSSWVGEDCCKWEGIGCSTLGYVRELNLRNPYHLINGGVGDRAAYKRSCLGGKLNHSFIGLKYLSYLDLSMNDFEGTQIPDFFGELIYMRYLNLSFASFSGEVPPHLGNLSSLQYLDLYADSYSSSAGTHELHVDSLHWLSGLSFLEHLNMGFVKLNGVGENWLQAINLSPSLVELNLHYCKLQGLPLLLPSINLTSLSVLDLSENSFNSLMPRWLFNLTSLTKLYLRWDFLSGPIPAEFANLKSLEVLDLSDNLNLEGQIPGLFGTLSKLKILRLSANSFSGDIHAFLGGFAGFTNNSLVSLDLSSNNLVGTLPESLGLLKNLQHLVLSFNSFWGSIPVSIEELSALRVLDVAYNRMNGTIPKSFGQLSKLVAVNLIINSWEGVLTETHLMNLKSLESFRLTTEPTRSLILNVTYEWVPPFRLKSIQLENCRVGPSFPMWLQVQSELTTITVKNAFISDTIQEKWFSQLSSQLMYLDLSKNQIKGKLPHRLESPKLNTIDLSSNHIDGPLPLWSTNATELFLHDNLFSGPIPENIGQLMQRLQKLYLSWNHLDGNLPSSLCELKSLQILSLRSNQFSGELPNCWYHSYTLWAVDVTKNSLSGNIPSSMGLLPSLGILMLGDNSLGGDIPSSLQNCSSLTSIDLSSNKFTGDLSLWIGRKPSLFMLRLRSNMFGGHIPQLICNLPTLHILDLSENEFSGEIPKCFGNLTALVYGNHRETYEGQIRIVLKGREPEYSSIIAYVNSINLSGNNLTGGIPNEITSLSALQILNLSRSNLSGSIPKKIGNLQHLETLDLSHNYITGPIPQNLSSMISLVQLNLSYNNLVGRVPQFLRFNDAAIYEGNPSLCGVPLTTKCPGDDVSYDQLSVVAG